jgi:hypothetical protein
MKTVSKSYILTSGSQVTKKTTRGGKAFKQKLEFHNKVGDEWVYLLLGPMNEE